MNKKLPLIFLFVIVIILLCTIAIKLVLFKKVIINDIYTYVGENDYWFAQYTISNVQQKSVLDSFLEIIQLKKDDYKRKIKKSFVLRYKDEIEDLYKKNLLVEYASSVSKGRAEESFDTLPYDNKIVEFHSAGSNKALEK